MLGTFIGKLIIKIEKLFHYNASSFPGRMVLKICPNYLRKIKYPENIIMVTGSSGKGSTVSLVKKIIESENNVVVANQEGSNLLDGITTTIISNVKGHKLKGDALVLEVDERYMKLVTKHIKPKYVIITNLTRDQPPRQGNFDIVFNEILKGIDSDVHLIVNGDDPILRKYSLIHKGMITYFGIDKTKYSYTYMDDIKDYEYCPKCHKKLEYSYYHYGSIGDYKCDCGFSRDSIRYSISAVMYDKNEIMIEGERIKINNLILFNLYNIIASYSITDILGIDKNDIRFTIEQANVDNKIYKEFEYNNRKVTVLNCKAENNATYNLSIIHTIMDDDVKTIVLGLRQISRRYVHYDLSWLYDINFEALNNVDKIICAGPFAYDFATRIKYAGFEDKIIILDDLTDIRTNIDSTRGNIYAILNFDYVDPFINNMKEDK